MSRGLWRFDRAVHDKESVERSRRSVLALVALAGIACSENRLAAAWPTGVDLGFLVTMPNDWRGSSTELEIEGPMTLAESPRFSLEAPMDARVFAVGLDGTSAHNAHPRVKRLEAWSLRGRSYELMGDPSCNGEGWVHGDREFELPMTAGGLMGQSFELNMDAAEFEPTERAPFADVLSFWAVLEPCFGGRRLVLTPFAEGTEGDMTTTAYSGVQFLDDDTLLVWDTVAVLVVRRGTGIDERRRLQITQLGLRPPPPGERWLISAAALSGSGESARGLVAVSRVPSLGLAAVEGRLLALDLSSEGLTVGREIWRSDSPGLRSEHRLERVAFDAQGTWVATGAGLVVTATSPSANPQTLTLPITFDGKHLVSTGMPNRPFLVSGGGYIRWFSPERGEGGFEEVPLQLPSSGPLVIDALSFSASEPGGGLLVLLDSPELGRPAAAAGGWRYRPVRTDEAEEGCDHEWRCGLPRASQRGNFVLEAPNETGPTSFVAPSDCGTVYLIDEVADCAISAPSGLELEAGPIGADRDKLRDAARRDEHVVFVGKRARILAARIE